MALQRQAAKRAMFVWLPNFAMRRVRLKQPPLARPREALALVEKHGNTRRIAALDEPAIRAGLYLHQPLADALAVLPALVTADAKPEEDRKALTALALWAQHFSPSTAPAPPDGLWLDIGGCASLWGGEEELVKRLLGGLKSRGFSARAAVAPTHGAAYALAHGPDNYSIVSAGDHCGRLAPLPVELLRLSKETASLLRKLGLSTIGHIRPLPRAELARRFPDLLRRYDEAMGLAPEAMDFLQPPAEWTERLRFAEPVSAAEDLERAAARLTEALCARLRAKERGARLWKASFFRADGDVQSASVATALPTRDAKRLLRLFREKLNAIDPGFGVDAVALAASHVKPLKPGQADFLRSEQGMACAEELAALLDSIENRLGQGRVCRSILKESHIPERAVERIRPLDAAPSRAEEGARWACAWEHLGERPIRLFAQPQPIEVTAALPDEPPIFFRWRRVVHRIRRAEGPERISAEWWRPEGQGGGEDEEEHSRDYYRVENMQGLRFWVYREGSYGGKRPPRWYLHGLFG